LQPTNFFNPDINGRNNDKMAVIRPGTAQNKIMPSEKVKELHQTVIDAVVKVKSIVKDKEETEEEVLTFGKKLADMVFSFVGSWFSIAMFLSFVVGWALFNSFAPALYRFDPYPYSLITFLLAAIAAIQAPVIMIGQHRLAHKNSIRLAGDLKIENEILSLHRSITVLMEQQLQQVHENQLTTITLLKELHTKSDEKARG